MELPKAYARRAGEIPANYRDPNINYNKYANQLIYVDKSGKPISGNASDRYDISNVTYWKPTKQSQIWDNNDQQIASSEQGRMDRVTKQIEDNERIRNQVIGGVETIAENLPVIGDALDIKNIYNDLQKGDNTSAAIGAAGLFLPNFIEKPIKYLNKGVKGLVRYGSNKVGFIPGMSFGDKRKRLQRIYNNYNNEVIPAAQQSYHTRYELLSDRYMLPETEQNLTKVPAFFVSRKRAISLGMPSDALGSYSPSLKRTLNTVNGFGKYRRLFFRKDKDILGTSRHELDHHVQRVLGTNETLPMQREYLQFLGTPVSEGKRFPITSEGINSLSNKKYYGVYPDNLTRKSGEIIPTDASSIPRYEEYITTFNPLAGPDGKYNFTWTSSPDELMSETAHYIQDLPSVTDRGKIFQQLSAPEKYSVTKRIAKRFGLEDKTAAKIMQEASLQGYLKQGGKFPIFNKQENATQH